MLKFLIFIAFFAVPSFFLIEAYSLEVEIDKESERIIESLGWTNIEKMAFQEQIQIIIDHTNKKNRISVGLLTTDPSDIRFPDYIENITNEPKIQEELKILTYLAHFIFYLLILLSIKYRNHLFITKLI